MHSISKLNLLTDTSSKLDIFLRIADLYDINLSKEAMMLCYSHTLIRSLWLVHTELLIPTSSIRVLAPCWGLQWLIMIDPIDHVLSSFLNISKN